MLFKFCLKVTQLFENKEQEEKIDSFNKIISIFVDKKLYTISLLIIS